MLYNKNMYRFFVSLIVLILIGGSFSTTVLAEKSFSTTVLAEESATPFESMEEMEITNLVYITQTDNKLEYTFTRDGENYKNIEYLSDRQAVSHLYKENPKTKKYEKYEVLTTTALEDGYVVQYHYESTGETEKVDLSSMIEVNNENEIAALPVPLDPDPGGGAPGPGGAGFRYLHTTNGTNTPTKWTIGAIGISISTLTRIPAAAKWVVNIANFTYQLTTSKVYYKSDLYQKGSGLSSTNRSVTRIYTNSNRTNQIGYSIVDTNRLGRTIVETGITR